MFLFKYFFDTFMNISLEIIVSLDVMIILAITME